MNKALKYGLIAGGAWAGLALISKAAELPSPAAPAGPDTKPKDMPLPVPSAPGGTVPSSTPGAVSYLREMTPSSKVATYKIFDDHDAVVTAKANILQVDPAVTESGMGRLNGTIASQLSTQSYVLVLAGNGGALVWIARASDLPALIADPQNAWVLYLRPGEYDSVKAAAYKLDPSTLPGDVATNFGKVLSGFQTNDTPVFISIPGIPGVGGIPV